MPERLLSRRFVMVWFANLFSGVAWALMIHLPGFIEDLGATESYVGFTIGIASVSAIAVRPWIGSGMDRRGRRPIILFGNAVQVSSTLLYLTVGALGPWLLMVRLIHGVAIGTMFTALSTYGADLVPAAKRTQGLALFGVSGMLPVALGGLIGDLVLRNDNWDAFFWTAFIFALIAAALSLGLPEVVTHSDEHRPAGFFKSLARSHLRPIWFVTLVFGTGLAAYFTFLRTFIDESGLGSVGLFFACYAGIAIALRVTVGWLPDRFGDKVVLAPALLAVALGLAMLSIASTDAHIAIAGLLAGTGHGFAFPILYSLTFTRSKFADRGSGIAIYTAMFDVGALIGGPLWGVLIERVDYSGMFVTASAVVVAGGLAFYAFDRHDESRAAEVAGVT
ncbi:MAG: MFS transporter [Acidimicrobiia bacterium]|nr:MFS transporter [Acidimicrobiia bacterium]NNC75848.1 MFS transporter [Acidimicrobiia bacterium]